jgi:hypothetical protein
VVVRTARGGALLLFDEVGEREFAVQASDRNSSGLTSGVSGLAKRADGSTAQVVDLALLIPTPQKITRRPQPS